MNRRSLARFIACGLAGSIAPVALAQTTSINVSGATLLENFLRAPGSTNDYIDVDGDNVAGALGSVDSFGFPIIDQLAPASITSGPTGRWGVTYRNVGSVNGFGELLRWGRRFVRNDSTATTLTGLRISGVAGSWYNTIRYVNSSAITGPGLTANPGAMPARANTTTLALARPGDVNNDGIRIDISPLDVPTFWAVRDESNSGNWTLLPAAPGYGNNPRVSTNRQGQAVNPPNSTSQGGNLSNRLPPLNDAVNPYLVEGEANVPYNFFNPANPGAANSGTIFDTAFAFAPICAMTNFGVGRTQIKVTELQYGYGTGRLPNGENLMFVTRDVGSGTRNGFQNSIGQDPSWGVGENIGQLNANVDIFDRLGVNFLPSNKGSNITVETTVLNHRLGIGYVGAERGVQGGWLAPNRADILAVQNDHIGGTQFRRPHISFVLNNNANGYIIGGPAVLATIGDPRRAPESLGGSGTAGGTGWPRYNWNRDTRPVRPASITDPLDPQYTLFKDPTPPASEPVNTNPGMRNNQAAAWVNNVARSVADFIRVPGTTDDLFMPGELAARTFILFPALSFLQNLNNPTQLIANTTNIPLQNYTLANNVIANPAYLSFNLAGVGRAPLRAALTPPATYSDLTTGATTNGETFRTQGGTTIGASDTLPLRNKISGDFDGNGLRNINDTADMLRAWIQRNGGPAWNAPSGTGADQSSGGIAGAPGADAIIEILGDFDGDGNFGRRWSNPTVPSASFAADFTDVRYFADGLALPASGGSLNRKTAFIRVDSEWQTLSNSSTLASFFTGGSNPAGDNNFFNTALATPKAYAAGDARGDVAAPGLTPGSTAPTTRGFTPIGADGTINAADIDYVFSQFVKPFNVAASNWFITGDAANWGTNLAEAVHTDLSADMTGDLIIDQADINELVVTILGTQIGDVNLDGSVTQADLDLANANLNTAGGWARGDMNGDKFVDAADIAIISAALPPTQCSPADIANTDGDPGPDLTIDNGDFTLFFSAFFADISNPLNLIADIANTDSDPGADGTVDNGDFTLFFAAFFAGCP